MSANQRTAAEVNGSQASGGDDFAVCAVVPIYNNARTIEGVVAAIGQQLPSIIVVDDGSTDGTAEALDETAAEVVTHASNRGKGAALLTGFQHAAERGFTHAVTMDADGQHDAADLPAVLAAAQANADALIVGVRDLSGRGRAVKSKLLRAHSNVWVFLETGKWIPDSQTGFRVFPLRAVLDLDLKTRKYDFEIESLVKLLWCGTPVVAVPVQACYGPGSESHFRPLRDFALVAHLNAKLLWLCLLLPPFARQALSRKSEAGQSRMARVAMMARSVVLGERANPAQFAASTGLGVCCGILPIWGFQGAAAIVAAQLFGLNKAIAFLSSNISFPAAIPFILYASLLTGRIALTGHIDWAIGLDASDPMAAWHSAGEYATGAVILALAAGAAATALSYAMGRFFFPPIEDGAP